MIKIKFLVCKLLRQFRVWSMECTGVLCLDSHAVLWRQVFTRGSFE